MGRGGSGSSYLVPPRLRRSTGDRDTDSSGLQRHSDGSEVASELKCEVKKNKQNNCETSEKTFVYTRGSLFYY